MNPITHIEQSVDPDRSELLFRQRWARLQGLHLDYWLPEAVPDIVTESGCASLYDTKATVTIQWVGMKGNPLDGGMTIDADSFEELCRRFLKAKEISNI